MTNEMIRHARGYKYHRAEGFCESLLEVNIEELPDAVQKNFFRTVIEWSDATGLSFEDAKGAVVTWVLMHGLKDYED